MKLDTAEKIFTHNGRTWFRIFSDSKVSNQTAVSQQEKLGYSVKKYGKPQGFNNDDLSKGGIGWVCTWYVNEIKE